MGYDIYFNGYVEFRDEAAMADGLAALNCDEEFFADEPVNSIVDALGKVLPADCGIGTDGLHGFSFSGETRDDDRIDHLIALLAPHATENTGVDYTGEDDAFWQVLARGGYAVNRDGVRTYLDPQTNRTDEYATGTEDALAAVEAVLISRIDADTEQLMATIRTYLRDQPYGAGQQPAPTSTVVD